MRNNYFVDTCHSLIIKKMMLKKDDRYFFRVDSQIKDFLSANINANDLACEMRSRYYEIYASILNEKGDVMAKKTVTKKKTKTAAKKK